MSHSPNSTLPSQSNVSSSIPRSASSPKSSRNPIFHLVNDFYARQQAAYMHKRKKHAAAPETSGTDGSRHRDPTLSSDDSAIHNASHEVSQSGTSSTVAIEPPADRLMKWSEKREQALRLIREEEERRRSVENTFHPNLERARGSSSQRHAAPQNTNTTIEVSDTSAATNRNLFDSSTISLGSGQAPKADNGVSRTSTENNNSASFEQLLPVRERLLALGQLSEIRKEQMRAQRDFEISQQYPFRPQLHHHDYDDVQQCSATTNDVSGARERHDRKVATPSHLSQDKECTFHPAIGPKSRQIYETAISGKRAEEANMDVYTRLYSRTLAAQAEAQPVNAKRADDRSAITAGGERILVPSAYDFFSEPLVEELQHLRLQLDAPSLDVRTTLVGAAATETRFRSDYFEVFLNNVARGNKVRTAYQSSAALAFALEEQEKEALAAAEALQLRKSLQETSLETGKGESTSVVSKPSSVSSEQIVSFDEFLARQDLAYRQRKQRLEEIERQTAPQLRPAICENSKILAQERHKKIVDGSMTSPIGLRRRALRSAELDFTFKPIITKIAAAVNPRGFGDMHKDQDRRKQKLEEFVKRSEVEKMAGVTFQPDTNRAHNAHVQSTLHPKNLRIFNEQLQKKRQQSEEIRQEQTLKNALTEFTDCTFKPQVNKKPSYISRMTSGVAIVREAQM